MRAEMLRAREDFNKALDEAETFCSTCVMGCSPNYPIEIPLDRAVQAEKTAEKLLVSAEYNRLATLGSSVWEVSKTEAFVKKALDRSGSSLDRFFSHLVLGHVYFSHLEKGAELTKVEAARKEFRLAIASLQPESANDAIRVHTGECYAIWAAHEVYLGNLPAYGQAMTNAYSAWTKMPTEPVLKTKWNAKVESANRGVRPEISCLFNSPVRSVPITLMPPVPSISVSPAPSLPVAPAPATVTPPRASGPVEVPAEPRVPTAPTQP